MKLDQLLAEFPWSQTYQRLCSEPGGPRELSLERARELIVAYRDSQIAVLSRGMYGPRLTPAWRNRGRELDAPDPERSEPRLPRFELSDPSVAARAFLRVAAQAGTGLRQFEPEHLAELDSRHASLGQLLRILAISAEPRVDPAVPFGQLSAAPFLVGRDALGPVLSPMFVLAVDPLIEAPRQSAVELTWELLEELGATDRQDELIGWTAEVVEAGSASIPVSTRLGVQRAPSEEVAQFGRPRLDFERTISQGRRGIHARDIVVAGDREVNAALVERIQSLEDIAEANFIYEPQPGLVRIRAWSEHPVPEHELMGAADESGARVIEFLNDTLM